MRRLLVLAVLVPTLARAGDETARDSLLTGGGIVVGGYTAFNTFVMLDELMKYGFSQPAHTVPSAFLSVASLLGSVAALAYFTQNRDDVGMAGGVLASMSSLVMCLVTAVAIHGWVIRQPSAPAE